MYKDVLVYTSTANSTQSMSEFACSFASQLGARINVLMVEVDDTDLTELERAITEAEIASAVEFMLQERERSRQAALELGAMVEAKARAAGIVCGVFRERRLAAEIGDLVSRRTRLFDCVLLPSVERVAGRDLCVAEEVLFGSGRPSILLPTGYDACSFDRVVIAWDGSIPATRAVHDALPFLRLANSVDVLTITDEKPLDHHLGGAQLARHLSAHGIAAHHDDLRFTGGSVGAQLIEAAMDRRAGFLIMGAYGHSRLKETVFGGATRSVLKRVDLPVLLSH